MVNLQTFYSSKNYLGLWHHISTLLGDNTITFVLQIREWGHIRYVHIWIRNGGQWKRPK